MEIFLSWSGERSGACARSLKEWLPCVLQSLDPWVSSHDIAKGERGAAEIAKKLDEVHFGIVCLTSENLNSNWINFESGALSKRLGGSALFTFLLDLKPSDVEPPLGQFQHTRAEKDEIFRLLEAINSKETKPLSSQVLASTFEKFWPDLEARLKGIPPPGSDVKTSRTEAELLEEILSHVRENSRSPSSSSDREVERRRTSQLRAFAEGYMIGRGEKEGTAGATASELGELTLRFGLYGSEYSIAIPIDSTWEEIKALIVREIDCQIIPF